MAPSLPPHPPPPEVGRGCLCPPAPWPHPALRTGVAVGAGQAVSSHLRRRLVTAVQKLLGAEHVAGVGHPVHAVQDADLGRARAQWARFLLPSPPLALGGPSLHPCRPLPPLHPHPRPSFPSFSTHSPGPGVPCPSCSFHPQPPGGSVHTPIPAPRPGRGQGEGLEGRGLGLPPR